MIRRIHKIFFICIFSFVTVAPVLAEEPIEVIRTTVDDIIAILNDPEYADKSQRDEQRKQMKQEIKKIFDFTTMSKGTIRHHQWQSFSEEQKNEFVDLFTQLLGDTYLDKIQGEYEDEKVEYLEQDMLSDSKAVVKTKILRDSVEIPVDYRLIKRDGVWNVYNVYVERTSLVSNYRDQFARILLSGSPADLIERLREKVKENE